jgi:competence protein ComEC
VTARPGAPSWLDRRPHHVAAAALAVGLAASRTPVAAVGLAAAAGLTLAAARAPRAAATVAVGLLVGATIGTARIESTDAAAGRALAAGRADGIAVVLEHPRPSRFGSSALLELRSGPAAGARVLARARAGMRWPEAGEPGVLARVSGSLDAPRDTAAAAGRGAGSRRAPGAASRPSSGAASPRPSGIASSRPPGAASPRPSGAASPHPPGAAMDWPAHLRRRGVAAELRLDSLAPTGGRRGGVPGAIDSMRRRAERALGAGTTPERAAVARGMVLGQDEAIDPLVKDDFRRSGLGHLLAVSGQNVMLLCALGVPLLAALGLGVRARAAGLAGLLALYVPIAGAGPSLQRAAVMGAAGLAALAAGRPSSRWYALLAAAAVTLAVNPLAVGDPGWQLSFAAVAGILLLAPPIRRALRGLPAPLAEGAAMTVAATLATAPIAAHHFGTVSAAGLGANLAALPLVAPIVWLGLVQAALGIAAPVLATAVGAVPGIGRPLAATGSAASDAATAAIGHVTGSLVGALLAVAREFAAAPGAQLPLPLASPLRVALAYALFGSGALGVRAVVRRAEPRTREAGAAWRRASVARRAAVAVGVVALGAVAWHRVTGPAPPPAGVRVSFLDVGQGDATLVQDGPRAAVLFDGGPPEARTYRLLRRAGVTRLALVVATHASRDHHGGLLEVLRRVPTGALLDGGDGTRDPGFAAVLAEARRRGVRRIAPRAGQTLAAGRLRIRVLGPPPRPPGPPPEDPNPRALATVVSAGSFDLFLSGDAESPALLGYDLPRVEAMKVSHHGSADPGLPELLRRLRPSVAAIEVGAGNSYGHPTEPTLTALRGSVPHVYRTDRDGTVRVDVDGSAMSISTGR